ncbi:MAG: ATP-binding protein [Candidatus Aenigmarchaeota archaeon]|nr:ATP-binding protein [Candidatus Aenigmarchaeota archaeon]
MTDKIFDVDLLRELQKDNLWWKENKIPEDKNKPFHRSDFYKYIEVLDSKHIQVLIGPRRVGKTILIYQLIKHLINDRNINSKNILYLDLAKSYIAFNIGGIDACLKVFQDNIIKKDFTQLNKNERIYVFIDEIQKEKGWAIILESIRSRNLPISFIVTGSSAPEIIKKSSESLVGRSKENYILHLKFKDIVRKELGYNEEKLKEIKDISNVFKQAVEKKDIRLFYQYLLKDLFAESLTPEFEIKVKNILNDYFLKGGYPEFYEEHKTDSWSVMAKTMRDDYFQRIISRDIVEVFGVNKPEVIRKLYLLIGFDTSNIANFTEYANIVKTKEDTLKEYFNYLNNSFLVSFSSKYYKKDRPKNARKKIYVSDIGMRNAVLGLLKEDISDGLGYIAETVAHTHCKRLKYKLHPTEDFSLDYWRYDKIEVDIILDLKNIVIPIEIKYRERIREEDKDGIKEFIKEFKGEKVKFGILVTKKDLFMDEDNNILGIPLWLFLLIC